MHEESLLLWEKGDRLRWMRSGIRREGRPLPYDEGENGSAGANEE